MAPRLSKIITHTGDDGTTGLSDGTRLGKDTIRIEAIGTIDELNSVLGIILATDAPGTVASVLLSVQHELFDLGAELATPGRAILTSSHVDELEKMANDFNDMLPTLKEFILPGGTLPAAHLHHARTVCRRAERIINALNKSEKVSAPVLKYLNRLSDLLFILARIANKDAGVNDVFWQAKSKPD